MNLHFEKIRLCLLSAILLLMTGTESRSLETSLETAVGYNDNVPLLPDKKGSAFMRYQIKSDHSFFSDSPCMEGDLFLTGIYRDYFRVSDNYQLKAGAFLNYESERFSLGISSEAMRYQDDYLEEDERNEIQFALNADWLFSARLTLGIRQSWIWADYRNPVMIRASGHHYGPGGAGMMKRCQSASSGSCGTGLDSEHTAQTPGSGAQEILYNEISRDDRTRVTGLEAVFFMSPEIQSHLLIEHRGLNSSLDMESCNRNGFSFSLSWMPDERWEISGTALWRRTEFDTERRDTLLSGNIGISRFIGKFELFFQFEWTDNDSSSDIECYRQTLSQCGMAFSF